MKHGALPNADEKFYFHMNNFDNAKVIEEDVIEEAPPPPPPPMFTEAQLEAAKKASFAEGHTQGKKEVEESRSQALVTLMQRLAADTQTLFAAEAAREATYERETISLCQAVFKQAFPVAHEKHGFDELTAQLGDVLQAQHGQRAIEIRVSADYAQGVEAFMEKLKTKNSELSFSVISDEAIDSGSFKLGWADGGALYDAASIAQRVLGKLEDTLAGGDTTSHDRLNKDLQEPSTVSDVIDEATGDDADADENPIAEENND